MSIEKLQHFYKFLKNDLIISSAYNIMIIITSDDNTKRWSKEKWTHIFPIYMLSELKPDILCRQYIILYTCK